MGDDNPFGDQYEPVEETLHEPEIVDDDPTDDGGRQRGGFPRVGREIPTVTLDTEVIVSDATEKERATIEELAREYEARFSEDVARLLRTD